MAATEFSLLVVAFRDDAAAYCDFVDTWMAAEACEPYKNLLRLLSNLSKSSAALPFDMPRKDVEETERIDHDRWKEIASSICKATGEACSALVDMHQDDEETLVRATMLWDDLSDLYRDLKHGLDLYELGDSEHMAEAIWQWRFGYENHWGRHLFRALTTVHDIHYYLRMD